MIENTTSQFTPLEIDSPFKPEKGTDKSDGSFVDYLKETLEEVNQMQAKAGDATRKLASGQSKDIHNVMISMQKASVSMELMMQVRNKIMSAYDEIRRMQI